MDISGIVGICFANLIWALFSIWSVYVYVHTHTHIHVSPTQDVGTCNDAMDLMCIERCVNSNFDETTCRTCEPTRPILTLTLSSVPEGETLEVTLEREANTELPPGYLLL